MFSIPYGRQNIDEADIAAVEAVLRSDWLTQGPAIERFERKVADYCGARHAVAVCNATAALHIACLGLGVAEGARVWTAPNTFVASANCARYCGADIDFVDIDGETFNLSPDALEAKFEQAAREGTLPAVLIPVHFAGQSCQMREIAEVARRYGCKVLEDASHAIGGRYLGEAVGGCRHSDAAVFSFHPVKIITSGEGGMVLTNDPELYQRLLRLRSHGITRDPAQMRGEAEGGWCYQQLELGFNYRMTDIQAALGASQMDRLDAFVERRRRRVADYRRELEDLPLSLPRQLPETDPAWHLLAARLDQPQWRRPLFDALRAEGILANVHYQPVYQQPYYRQLGFRDGLCPVAEAYYQRALSLPLYYDLTDEAFDRVIQAVRTSLSEIAS
ncbi:UDP-4-amino-4,6-dideoxy-N-acetyl-beta-L-altrosamine transaminase [Chromobacterium phragmitis]|uniref:UDP-4-amino-4, 6-dideoxy-N-acetyl-beta-L-altrosamine transaminase n=1 Tax=Chromobacterium phragmitis TaxID=2202141 RepID=A0A344UH49_9NEIS|nr:UDP-4-amino-4,6-dideoxy-N-acetyl-beta-L-altrosamine transaminase [Chromobacterium phragmitis]AXE29238.1 UDP-4-amino-4,6-dideoxy-N-acetyl-beta-L-altrosamine transaminase [Chromobacterium phragmitis]AXE34597.1 UDP-4-amino-4,6-dideoxy-N-acetyl-beta-L-altrosamine transaminase [Chromobacterium phragmitis]